MPASCNPSPRLQVVYRALASLRNNPKNARQHSNSQINKLKRSVVAFGPTAPILVDRDLKIIAGHARAETYRRLGLVEVPTISLDHLNPQQAQAYSLADNRIGELSTWDDRLLTANIKELAELSLEFDIEATGFETAEIDLRVDASPQSAPDDAAEGLDRFFDEGAAPVCRPGDLWHLGPHKLFCGDALDEESYKRLLGTARVATVFTDPPFNVRIKGHASGNGRFQHDNFAMASGEMTDGVFQRFLTDAFGHMVRYSREGAIHFICMDWRHQPEILAAGGATYAELKNLCVWVKTNAGMGSLYRSQHELVYVYKTAGGAHRNNVCLGKFGRNRTNVWTYAGATSPARGDEERGLLALHPTVKPVQLIADALMDCSARKDLVLDPFVGSGSTIIAAERTGRHARAIELDPKYADTAIRRWQAFTRHEATHAETAETFAATQGARR